MKPSKDIVSQLLPNTYPFPNIVMDELEALGDVNIWSLLEAPEKALLPIVYRKTFGWWKRVDKISLSQLAKASGYNRDTTNKYMGILVTIGLVTQISTGRETGEPNEWSPQIDDTKINYDFLLKRKAKKQEGAGRKMSVLRSKRKKQKPVDEGHLMPQGTLMPQDTTRLMPQDTTRLMPQDTQKPENKENQKPLTPSQEAEAIQEGMDAFTKFLEFEAMKLGMQTSGKAWRGREMLPSNLVPYGDWWYSKTNLEMYSAKGKAKLNLEWQKAFREWWENDVTLATLNTVYEAEKSWKGIISKPSELTTKAKALQVLPPPPVEQKPSATESPLAAFEKTWTPRA